MMRSSTERVNAQTLRPIPAAQSNRTTDAAPPKSPANWTRRLLSCSSKLGRPRPPPMPGSSRKPPGPSTMASSMSHWPSKTSARVRSGCTEHRTSALAKPKSMSTRHTSERPVRRAIAKPRFKLRLVLPTPPLPEATATRRGPPFAASPPWRRASTNARSRAA